MLTRINIFSDEIRKVICSLVALRDQGNQRKQSYVIKYVNILQSFYLLCSVKNESCKHYNTSYEKTGDLVSLRKRFRDYDVNLNGEKGDINEIRILLHPVLLSE